MDGPSRPSDRPNNAPNSPPTKRTGRIVCQRIFKPHITTPLVCGMPLPPAIGSLPTIHAIASAAATAATAHGAISHGVSRIRAYIQRDASVPYSMPRRYTTTSNPETRPMTMPAAAIFHFKWSNRGISRRISCAASLPVKPGNSLQTVVADGQSISELIWMMWSRCGPVPITEMRQPDSSSRRLT